MLNTLGLAGVVALNLVSASCVIAFEYHHLHDEDHLFENLQALLLGLGVLCGSLLLRDSGREFLVWAGLAVLSLSLLLREVDLDQMPVHGALQALGTGTGRAVLLGPLWLALGFGFWNLGALRWQWLREVLVSPVFLCQVLAFALLVVSALIDRKLLGMTHPRLAEELLEINAYAFLIWPAVYRLLRQLRPSAELPSA
jgi:hypothetical protein